MYDIMRALPLCITTATCISSSAALYYSLWWLSRTGSSKCGFYDVPVVVPVGLHVHVNVHVCVNCVNLFVSCMLVCKRMWNHNYFIWLLVYMWNSRWSTSTCSKGFCQLGVILLLFSYTCIIFNIIFNWMSVQLTSQLLVWFDIWQSIGDELVICFLFDTGR